MFIFIIVVIFIFTRSFFQVPPFVQEDLQSQQWFWWFFFSIISIFLIIAVVEKSITLPCILVAVIELAIFINLGLPHF